jgi:membrane fusion protein (multidrug efflux system)
MWALLLSLVFLFACGKKEQKPQEQRAQKPVVITTYTVSSQEVEEYYTTKGYFESPQDVILKPEISGRVAQLYVEEGAFVRAGQPLLKIDSSEYENTLRQLQAQLSQAKVNYENQLMVSKTVLRAPFSGYIAQRFVSVGDYLTPQSQTFRLVSLNPIRMVFQIPQELIAFGKVGKMVDLEVEGVGTLKGKVVFVSPTADQSRLLTLKALVDNRENLIKPGMYALVKLPTQKVSAFVVPERAVVLRGTKKIVWKVEEQKVMPVEVQVLKQEGGKAYIKADLKDGDQIALDNAFLLREGVAVEIKR